jgi:hypothetical protein
MSSQFVGLENDFGTQLYEQLLKALKWLTIHCLDLVECMHHVGFDLEVLGSPTKTLS